MKRIYSAVILMSFIAGSLWAQTKTVTKKPSATTKRTTTTKKAPATRRSLLNPSSLNEKAPATYKAKFTTTKGVFVVQVTRDWAPLGADRFYNLVKNGYFTDASFFRVISGFMVQFGINAKPTINAVWQSANIQDDPVKQSNKRGYITFAMSSAPNSRTTQVFINFGDNAGLDAQGFAPFGQVTEGMDVVDKLYAGYGEGAPQGSGPEQGMVQSQGKPYLDKNFPKLDSIKSAMIEGTAAPATKTPSHTTSTHKAPAKTTATPK